MTQPNLSYQWERKPFGGNYSSISGAISNTLNLTGLIIPVNHKDTYRCLVSANQGASPVYSTESLLYLFTEITVTSQPNDVFSEYGDATFACSGVADPSTPLYYIWQKAESSSPTVFNNIVSPTNTNNILSLSGLTFANDNNDKYRCRIVASDGTGEITTNVATLSLLDLSAPATITITQQPQNTIITTLNSPNTPVAISGSATLSNSATPIYIWEYLNSLEYNVSDSTLMNSANWQPIVSNRILFNFDSGISDSGDFNLTTTGSGISISNSIKQYGSGSLLCSGGKVFVAETSNDSQSRFSFTSDFTIEGWFYFSSNTPDQMIVMTDNGNPSVASGWSISLDNTSKLKFFFSNTVASTTQTITTNFIPTISQWYHICIMRTNDTIKVFVDGTSVGSFTTPLSNNKGITGGSLTIGGPRDASTSNCPNAGLLLLHFDGANGATTGFVDSSDNAFSVTSYNGGSLSSTQKKFGISSLFCDGNGRGAYVSGGSNNIFNVSSIDFTVECWFYPIELRTAQLFIISDIGIGTPGLCFGTFNNGTFFISNGSTAGPTLGGTYVTNQWYHMAITRTGGIMRVFINGILINSNQSYAPSSNGNAILIGASTPNWGNFQFNGYIDEFRLVKNAALYTSNFTPQSTAFCTPPSNFDGYIDDLRIVGGKAVYSDSGFTPPQKALTKYVESTLSISKNFIDDLPVNGVDDILSRSLSQYIVPTRDKRIRLKITHPTAPTVYSNIIRYVFPVYGYYNYYGFQVADLSGPVGAPTQTETTNGIAYSVYNRNRGDDLYISLYDDSWTQWFGKPSADLLWYNDNASAITLESSTDASNWSVVSSGGFKYGNFTTASGQYDILDVPTETTVKSVYYRFRFFDTWPYDVNNGTSSSSAPTVYFPIVASSSAPLGTRPNFKINWT